MQCRQGYARTFHAIAIIQRHGVYVDEEEERGRGEREREKKKKFDTYTRNLNFRFWSDIEEGNQGEKKTIFLVLCSANKSFFFFFFLNIFSMKK